MADIRKFFLVLQLAIETEPVNLKIHTTMSSIQCLYDSKADLIK